MGDGRYVWFVCAMGEERSGGCVLEKISSSVGGCGIYGGGSYFCCTVYRKNRLSRRATQLERSRTPVFSSLSIPMAALGVAMCCSCLLAPPKMFTRRRSWPNGSANYSSSTSRQKEVASTQPNFNECEIWLTRIRRMRR